MAPAPAAAAIAMPMPPASATPAPDPLDLWLTAMDEPENAVAAMLAQSGASVEERWPQRPPRVIADTDTEHVQRSRVRSRIASGFHLRRGPQRTTSTRRTRPLGILLLCLLMVFAALGAVGVTFDLSLDQGTRAISQFAAPPVPRLPPRPSLRLALPLELPKAAEAVAADAVPPAIGSPPAIVR
jgi:predicted secreted protein